MARAVWENAVSAEGEDLVLLEGNCYFRREDIHWQYLKPSSDTTICDWKEPPTMQSWRCLVLGESEASCRLDQPIVRTAIGRTVRVCSSPAACDSCEFQLVGHRT
jgi:hypothetical protein